MNYSIPSIIQSNWQRVCSDVADACLAAGRRPEEVTVVGVSKYVGPKLASILVGAGCKKLGENRPQQLWEKYAWFEQQQSEPDVEWHFIGHLQRNKVKRTLPMIRFLHSLDSPRLAESVSSEATQQGLQISALIDVNVTDDLSKTGLPAADLEPFVEQVLGMPGIQLRGLMAMSSLHADEAAARREFAQVRQLRDTMQAKFGERVEFSELSMGMSGDFREAILEGASIVRIGSNLWEGISPDDFHN